MQTLRSRFESGMEGSGMTPDLIKVLDEFLELGNKLQKDVTNDQLADYRYQCFELCPRLALALKEAVEYIEVAHKCICGPSLCSKICSRCKTLTRISAILRGEK